MDRFSGRDDNDKAAPRGSMGQVARGGLGAFVKSSTSMGGSTDGQKPIQATSVTLSRTEQARAQQAQDTAKRVSAAVAAAVAADPARGGSLAGARLASGFQPPGWAVLPPAGMVLQGVKNGEVVQREPLTQRGILFGRLATADVQLEHASISRQHAALCFRSDGTAMLMDLDSAHGTFLDGNRMVKHEPMILEEGVEVRFGASTRSFFLRREGPAPGAAKKRSVQWPDEEAGPSKRERPELETVIGFSDGSSFTAGVGPAPAAPEQQGRFAGAITAVVKPLARPPPAAAGGAPSPTATPAGGPPGPPAAAKEQAESEEDKAAARKRLAAERFREYMKSHAQKQSSFYDELPPPAVGSGEAVSASNASDASAPPDPQQ